MAIQNVQSFKTADGEIFATLAAAEAHELFLENKEAIDAAVEAYVNTLGATGRSRAIKIAGAVAFLSFYLGWDGEAVDAPAEPEVKAPVAPAAEEKVELAPKKAKKVAADLE